MRYMHVRYMYVTLHVCYVTCMLRYMYVTLHVCYVTYILRYMSQVSGHNLQTA